MIDWLITLLRSSHHVLYIATYLVASLLFLSGLDDVFIDMYYWFHHMLNRRKFERFKYDSPERLSEIAEKPIAIFVPAWQEHEVIDKMLLNACRTIQYKNYDIFV